MEQNTRFLLCLHLLTAVLGPLVLGKSPRGVWGWFSGGWWDFDGAADAGSRGEAHRSGRWGSAVPLAVTELSAGDKVVEARQPSSSCWVARLTVVGYRLFSSTGRSSLSSRRWRCWFACFFLCFLGADARTRARGRVCSSCAAAGCCIVCGHTCRPTDKRWSVLVVKPVLLGSLWGNWNFRH